MVDGAPHYFSHPNYANSPLPDVQGTPTYFGNALSSVPTHPTDPVGVGELAPVFVVFPTALPDGILSRSRLEPGDAGSEPVPFGG